MTQIGSFEAKTHFSDLLRRVALGEHFVVTMRGKPVARLISANERQDAGKVKNLMEELQQFRSRIAKRGPILKAGESYKDLAREGLKK
jgi:prevent-host-death family protein